MKTFEEWMLDKELSRFTVRNYQGAIDGSLSEWAIQNGICTLRLSSFKRADDFNRVASKIRLLPIFQVRNTRGNGMYSAALEAFAKYLLDMGDMDEYADIDEIVSDSTISTTEKEALVKCRIGQGTFRQSLVDYWKRCAISGYENTNLLVASHIKPWRLCTNEERLDPFNGLLLLPNFDKAFDMGMISFRANGEIMLSPRLAHPEQLGISEGMRIALTSRHERFMRLHRSAVFCSRW